MMELRSVVAYAAMVLALAACSGDDGNDGATGANGATGATGVSGLNSLTRQTPLAAGSARCTAGGVLIESGLDSNRSGTLDDSEVTASDAVCDASAEKHFVRVATFAACEQLDAACDTDQETAAEIVSVTPDGLTAIYTDAASAQIGFVDISNPVAPAALGVLATGGEPTSVATVGALALVAVDTSPDFVNPAGNLLVVDVATQTIVRTIDLGGQPDSVAVSPDGRYAAVAIENQRDEDLGNGAPEQLPSGFLVVLDLAGAPAAWTLTNVAMNFPGMLYPNDAEPEFVDINANNVAVVTLQENNHIALVDLATATVLDDFSAGTVDLTGIDITDERPNRIDQTADQAGRLREPDGVAWLTTELLVTADEGDLDGGSRGITVFSTNGNVVFNSGNTLDREAARIGHYPDKRSDAKGNESENVEVATFGNDRLLFVNAERSSVTFVYDVNDPAAPVFLNTLPTLLAPEGAVAVPARNLLLVASENDDRGGPFRGGLSIYRYATQDAAYPTIRSADRPDGSPIPWAALSGLAADPAASDTLYSIEDSFFAGNRIFRIDVSTRPATLAEEIRLVDSGDVFAAFPAVSLADASVPADGATRAGVFDEADLDALINGDKTVNIDPEGIAVASGGGFWVASEGTGSVAAAEAGRPINSRNFLFRVTAQGVIESVVTLPDAVNDAQFRFGFEGVAEYDNRVYVAFQRPWTQLGDAPGTVRIGVYDPAAESWSFLLYPLDSATSPNGGWVGLSDITSLGGGEFMVIERDNQFGPDARIKRLYTFDVTGVAAGGTVTKTLLRDLLAGGDLTAAGGLAPEKIEGAAVTLRGDVYIVNDNDGVDDNSGETQLINLGRVLP